MSEPKVIGIDIGGTKTLATLVNTDGKIFRTIQNPTSIQDGVQALLNSIVQLCQQLITPDVFGIGIGSAGQIDTEAGTVTYANQNLPDWTGTPIRQFVESQLNLPVSVDNDVNAMAMGEHHFGAGRPYQDVLYITVGTGVGGAFILDNQLRRGAHFSAGELGYLVADWDDSSTPITIEMLASGPGMEAHYFRQTQHKMSLKEITQKAENGDHTAQETIQKGAYQLGTVLAPVICTLDPQAIVIGGGVPNIGERWWQPFESAIRSIPLPACQQVQIHKAKSGTMAVALGAAYLATMNNR